MPDFQVVSEYRPAGDQPEPSRPWPGRVEMGLQEQTLLGESQARAETFTMAKTIERIQRPHWSWPQYKNPGRPALRRVPGVFPHNAVEYFVSTTTTTSRRPISPYRHLYGGRMPPPTVRLTACASRPPAPCWSGGT